MTDSNLTQLDCPNNCHGRGLCVLNSTEEHDFFPFAKGNCLCDFGFSGKYCEQSWKNLFWSYVIFFSLLFGFISMVAIFQFCRFIYLTGWKKFNASKILHFFVVILCVSRLIWLNSDPHNLRDVLNPFLENLLSGIGIYLVVLMYLIVLYLWATTYKHTSMGKFSNYTQIFKYTRAIALIALGFFMFVELGLRIAWRQFRVDSYAYMVIISFYYFSIAIAILILASGFLFYGLRLYNNYKAFQDVTTQISKRLTRITGLTTGVTTVCLLTLFWLIVTWLIEMIKFKFENMISFLIEQTGFRFTEILACILILWFLRDEAVYQAQSIDVENTPILENIEEE